MASSDRRIIALWFARLATDRLIRRWRSSPPPDGHLPLVLVAKQDNAMRLMAVDPRASALGLHPGMALASARAMVPMLKVMAAHPEADAKLLEQIADWCECVSPLVGLDGDDGLLIDVTGVSHLFGGEEAMLSRLCAALTRQGLTVAAAMAGTAAAAHALARYRDGTIVAPGEDRSAMAGLPVDALGLDPAMTHAFRRAGLKKIAQVAARKRAELTARFGAAMVFRLDTALGLAETPISPRRPLPPYRVEHRFAEPVATTDIMLATVTALAGALGKILEERGEGGRLLEAAFFRADGMVRRLAVETGAPVRDPAILERLFREKMDALADPLDPGFGFDVIRLEALRVEASTEEAIQLGSKAGAEKELRLLADRLAARLGSQRIQVFRAVDSHIPERASVTVPAQYAGPATTGWRDVRRPHEAPRRPLRMVTPEPVEMLAAGRFRWRHAERVIRRLEGPERIAMEWWRAPGPDRDYYRVEDEAGRRYWLYREESGRWFLHGLFA